MINETKEPVMRDPNLRLLSLGAGVQSTVLALMAADGTLPGLDGAIFADTGWEPRKVYAQVDRLAAVLEPAGIPLYRVSKGNLRADAINPEHRFASVPYFVLNPPYQVAVPVEFGPCPCRDRAGDWQPAAGDDVPLPGFAPPPGDPDPDCEACDGEGEIVTRWTERPATRAEREGMGRRQCTSEYKLVPIKRKVRELLGAAAPDFRRVPRGQVAEQWIGFSTDEITRVSDNNGVSYIRQRYPLLDLGMSRDDCRRWLTARGWGDTAKSACIGCPYHGNAQWRDLRDNSPDEFADAVAFDEAIRKGGARGLPLNGEAFLHRSRVPLAIAPIDKVTRRERAGDVMSFADLDELGDPDGCSPYGCRSGSAA
jgi:hypothetical protein